jgi:hypothetical protein
MSTEDLSSGRLRRTLALPHFVGIGAPRCGTTWVFKMLRLHPQVWIPWKELHYFDSVDPGTDSGFAIQSRAFRWHHGWRSAATRLAVRSVPGAQTILRRRWPLRAVHAPGYRWTARYLLGRATPEWYEGLFREGSERGLRCGEITPAYFMLSTDGIRGFARLLPQVRAFMLLRSPLQWAWSDLCKSLQLAGIDPSTLTTDELIARCRVPTGHGRADFGANLGRWLDNFPRERLLIGSYDELRTEPVPFLERLCEFIGVGPVPVEIRRLTGERINSSVQGAPIPAAVGRYIAERFHAETRTLAELIGAPATQWLAEIESILLPR